MYGHGAMWRAATDRITSSVDGYNNLLIILLRIRTTTGVQIPVFEYCRRIIICARWSTRIWRRSPPRYRSETNRIICYWFLCSLKVNRSYLNLTGTPIRIVILEILKFVILLKSEFILGLTLLRKQVYIIYNFDGSRWDFSTLGLILPIVEDIRPYSRGTLVS